MLDIGLSWNHLGLLRKHSGLEPKKPPLCFSLEYKPFSHHYATIFTPAALLLHLSPPSSNLIALCLIMCLSLCVCVSIRVCICLQLILDIPGPAILLFFHAVLTVKSKNSHSCIDSKPLKNLFYSTTGFLQVQAPEKSRCAGRVSVFSFSCRQKRGGQRSALLKLIFLISSFPLFLPPLLSLTINITVYLFLPLIVVIIKTYSF